MSEATSGSNGRVTEYLTTGDPAYRYAHAGYWLQYFADAARASRPMMVVFASPRNSIPAPPKSLKLFGSCAILDWRALRGNRCRALDDCGAGHAMLVKTWKT
jgi:hypothetical protein